MFNKNAGYRDLPVKLPCGQCVGCRLERSRQWAIRCSHEASLYEDNAFITLTYSDAHLPSDGSLNLVHFQKFIKRLRKQYGPKIRYYHCGEYGEKFKRPHYHACLFNFDFEDKKLFQIKNNNRYYTSEILQTLWPMGFSIIGDVTFQSAAYVARYIMKKINGAAAENHYANPETGEILKPEYTTMSRRPGIGSAWLKKYQSDVYPGDFVVMGGKKMKPPKYYDRQYELTNPSEYGQLKTDRVLNAKKFESNNTPERLKTREVVQKARLNLLPRKLEEG